LSIEGTTAGLVIGDRALEQRNKSKYSYDLGQAWKELTGLPFVFAVWVSNKPMDKQFIEKFNMSNALGIKHIIEVVKLTNFLSFDLELYYFKYIKYQIDNKNQKGLNEFLSRVDKQSHP
jgi:chorismate dehydratase